jgi:hypothetical protein
VAAIASAEGEEGAMKPMSPTEAAGEALEFFKLKERLANAREKLRKEREKNQRLEEILDRECSINGDTRMRMAQEEIAALKRANTFLNKLLEGRLKDKDIQRYSFLTPVQLITSKRLYREIVFHIHPDRIQDAEAKARAEKCLTEFNALKTMLYEEDR